MAVHGDAIRSGRSAYPDAGSLPGECSGPDDELAVDEYMFDARLVAMGIRVGRLVLDRVGIENHDVSECPFCDPATFCLAILVRWHGRHLPDRVFERNDAEFADVAR